MDAQIQILIASSIMVGLLYSLLDSIHDKWVIKGIKEKWHWWDALIKGFIAIVIGLLTYYMTQFPLQLSEVKSWLLFAAITGNIIASRKWTFNFFLNLQMKSSEGWSMKTRRKKGFDKIPDWTGLACIVLIVVLSIFIF